LNKAKKPGTFTEILAKAPSEGMEMRLISHFAVAMALVLVFHNTALVSVASAQPATDKTGKTASPPAKAQVPVAAPSPSAAQPPLAEEQAPPSAAQPPSTTEQAPTAPPPTAAEAPCVPTCRSGFVCRNSTCISECNPPCPEGESCDQGIRCIANPVMVSAGVPAAAEPYPVAENLGRERHDGFLLRLALGFGGAISHGSPRDDNGLSKLKVTGGAANFSFDVGGAVTENLVLHGRIADFEIVNPTIYVAGEKLGKSDEAVLDTVLLGPALTYYVMPVNLYLTAAVGLSKLQVRDEDDEVSGSTDMGVAFNFDIGKEWWVADDWGIGVAARFWYTHASEEDFNWNFSGLSVLFSATYQ